ncbi:hypothetical protein T05_13569 [Trichinella murrelli]|uniref:Uncharacterized protein n=1 Tax=Trichinella murrelli TaxID=144512 RepID=A0A0V0TT94_9BILA|nr:hypothetical protein T05_13569 [Trichinella murrelli]
MHFRLVRPVEPPAGSNSSPPKATPADKWQLVELSANDTTIRVSFQTNRPIDGGFGSHAGCNGYQFVRIETLTLIRWCHRPLSPDDNTTSFPFSTPQYFMQIFFHFA